jgi:hypothetical protein
MTRVQSRPATYVKKSYVEKVALVNRNLREGDIVKCSKKVSASKSAVEAVVVGAVENPRILNAMYNIARTRKDQIVR